MNELIEWVHQQAHEHEWRQSGDNDWWHGYVAALKDVLDKDRELRGLS